MNTREAIQSAADTSMMILKSYVGDLEDADLLVRPGEGCNHIAWQLGHLISAECNLLNMIKPGAAIELPEGFAEKHNKEACGSDDPADFCTKEEYLELYERARAATAAVLETMSDSDLDAPTSDERFSKMFPTVGSMFVLTACHPMMHAGQFVPVRRAQGKPIVI